MTYTVRYRRVGGLFWNRLRRVKGDGFVFADVFVDEGKDANGAMVGRKLVTQFPFRWFVLEDETRVELPSGAVEVRFSRERYLRTTEVMSAEAGLPVTPNPR